MTHVDRQSSQQMSASASPLESLDWSTLSLNEYWLPPSAVSLHGVAEFEALPQAAKIKLSQYEFIATVQAGLRLEAIFMERLAKGLKRSRSAAEYSLLLREIREEAGHSLMFMQLLERCGLPMPPLERRTWRFAEWLGRYAPFDGALFWLAVMIGEEVPDRFNRQARRDASVQINPLIRQVRALHIAEEASHIAYARKALDDRVRAAGNLQRAWLGPMIGVLLRQFVCGFYFPDARLYDLAGLTPGDHWRRLARANPLRHAFMGECLAPVVRLLGSYGFAVNARCALNPRFAGR